MIKKIFLYFSTGVLVLVMVGAAFILIAPKLGWEIEAVVSNSMAPTFKSGDLVITQSVNPDNIELGDVITYTSPIDGKLITHRVIEITKQSPLVFKTKGDTNEDPDGYLVPSQNVVGRVNVHIPLLGYFSAFTKTLVGFIVLLLVPGLIIIAMEIRDIWLAYRELKLEQRYQVR